MSEEPKAPKVPEPNGEIPPEKFQLDRPTVEDSPVAPLAEELRRVTGDLDFPGETPSPDAPESSLDTTPPLSQPPDVGEIRGTDSLLRRITGSIKRNTGPLGGTAPLSTPPPDLPANDVDEAFDTRLSSLNQVAPPSPPPTTPRAEQPPSQGAIGDRRETNSLMRRITGSLRRATGSLGDTRPLRTSRIDVRSSDEKPALSAGEEGLITPEAGDPGEKRKRVSGPLGSVLSGILRSSPGEGEKAQPAKRKSDADDYVSEIRQNLASEESILPKRTRRSGLLQLLTGNLKRMTGSLGHTGEMRRVEGTRPVPPEPVNDFRIEPEPPHSEIEAEIEEVLLEDRLAGTVVSEPFTWAEPEDFVIELGPPEAESFEQELPESSESLPEPENLSGDEPISLLDSGAIAALGQAEEGAREPEIEPDWMAEIRHEAAEEESEKASGDSPEKRKGVTNPLRDFIAGIFHTEEKQAPAPDAEFSDDLVTGRLGMDLSAKPVESGAAPGEPGIPDWAGIDTPLSGEYAAQKEGEDLSAEEDDTSFLDRFEARFGQIADEETAETGQAQATQGAQDLGEDLGSFVPYEPLQTHDTGEVFTISPEDEKLLWGTPPEEEAAEPKTFSADDYWDPLKMNFPQAEPEPKKPEFADDAYAAAFLTGADLPPDTDRLKPRKRRVTGKLNRETEKKPFEDIRSVLLDDYQAAEQQRRGRGVEASTATEQVPEPDTLVVSEVAYAPGFLEADEELSNPRPRNLKEWLATRTILQKIILVEMILVVLALVTAVPFFFYLLMRGPQPAAAAPNKLPANLPYPAGLTLPGGWNFKLGRSTMVNEKWKPAQSEWLEGTELRRVVALPWTRQTEAVVRSFQPGDEIALDLSNADTIKYSVERIEQVSIDDTSIYSDLTPSLVIILYTDGKTDQTRWVVFCKR